MDTQTLKVVSEAKGLIKGVEENSRIVVKSQPTMDIAITQLSVLRAVKKEVKEKKDSILIPLREATKSARELFAPVEERIAKVEAYLNGTMLKYRQKLLAEQEAREAKAEKEIESGTPIEQATKKVGNTNQKLEQIKVRKVVRLRINDKKKIPLEYLIPNEMEIKKALQSGIKVAGCELYSEEVAVNRY